MFNAESNEVQGPLSVNQLERLGTDGSIDSAPKDMQSVFDTQQEAVDFFLKYYQENLNKMFEDLGIEIPNPTVGEMCDFVQELRGSSRKPR